MPVASKVRFVPYTPNLLHGEARQSKRDVVRSELSEGLNAAFESVTGIADMGVPYAVEEYARIAIWCLGWMLYGWPHDIVFTNLSNIKGGIRALQILKQRLENGTLRFVRAPQDVRERALHDPESVLPHIMTAATLPPDALRLAQMPASTPRTRAPKRAQLLPPVPHPVAETHANSESPSAPVVSAPRAEELVLHPDTLEPMLCLPLGPGAARGPHERRQRCDVNKARHRPSGRKSHSRKVGALTSRYVLDSDTHGGPSTSGPRDLLGGGAGEGTSTPDVNLGLGTLAGEGLPLMVDEFVGDYVRVPGA